MADPNIKYLKAEELFDAINIKYEEAFSHNPALFKKISELMKVLPPQGRVLDVGCGTGKPVSSTMADAGLQVTGIDVSQKMIDLCKKNVKGNFTKANAITYEPDGTFDAIISILSLLQVSFRQTAALAYKFNEWLRPGGKLLISTIVAENNIDDPKMYDPTGRYIDNLALEFMGHNAKGTLITKAAWREILEAAGFEVVSSEILSFQPSGTPKEDNFYIVARKTGLHPLLGPYPHPDSYRGPRYLAESGWKPFAERLVRREFDAVVTEIKGNKEVLDVGSGHGGLSFMIASQVGKAYSVEPHEERNKVLLEQSHAANVEVSQGSIESLPFPDKRFDAAVASWVLHYTEDLEKAVKGLVRVIDPSAADARIIIILAAPYGDMMWFISEICVPLATDPGARVVDHHGFILSKAAEVLKSEGFGTINLTRTNSFMRFPEKDLEERCAKAAKVLAGIYFVEDPRFEEMQAALVPELKKHFDEKPFEIGDEAVMLVATP